MSEAPYSVCRDFIGYGAAPPNPRWPGGARLAVNFVMNIEQGSEYAIEHGETRSDVGLTEAGVPRVPAGKRDLATESMFEFGSRVGFWRLQALFRERGIPVTAFACAVALERNPAIAETIASAGWDFAAMDIVGSSTGCWARTTSVSISPGRSSRSSS